VLCSEHSRSTPRPARSTPRPATTVCSSWSVSRPDPASSRHRVGRRRNAATGSLPGCDGRCRQVWSAPGGNWQAVGRSA